MKEKVPTLLPKGQRKMETWSSALYHPLACSKRSCKSALDCFVHHHYYLKFPWYSKWKKIKIKEHTLLSTCQWRKYNSLCQWSPLPRRLLPEVIINETKRAPWLNKVNRNIPTAANKVIMKPWQFFWMKSKLYIMHTTGPSSIIVRKCNQPIYS